MFLPSWIHSTCWLFIPHACKTTNILPESPTFSKITVFHFPTCSPGSVLKACSSGTCQFNSAYLGTTHLTRRSWTPDYYHQSLFLVTPCTKASVCYGKELCPGAVRLLIYYKTVTVNSVTQLWSSLVVKTGIGWHTEGGTQKLHRNMVQAGHGISLTRLLESIKLPVVCMCNQGG